MTSALLVARSIADRIIEEDHAIALHGPESAHASSVAFRIMEALHVAAKSDGIDAQEAEDVAAAARDIATLAWLDSPPGRAALRVASTAIARDRRVIGDGLTASAAHTIERVGQDRIAARLAERDSPRAQTADAGAAAGNQSAGQPSNAKPGHPAGSS